MSNQFTNEIFAWFFMRGMVQVNSKLSFSCDFSVKTWKTSDAETFLKTLENLIVVLSCSCEKFEKSFVL